MRLGLASEDRVRAALTEQDRTSERLTSLLVRQKIVDGRLLADAIARAHSLGRADPATIPVAQDARRFVTREWALSQGIVPAFVDDQTLIVAVTDPMSGGPLDELSFRTGYRIRPLVLAESDLPALVQRVFGDAPPVTVGTPSTPPPPDSRRPAQSVPPKTGPTRVSQAPAAYLSVRPAQVEDPATLQALRQLAATQDQAALEIQALFELCIERGLLSRREYYDRLERLPE